MSDEPFSHHPAIADGQRFAEGQRITWVSVGVNLALTSMQVVVALLAHSQSLLADAMHTLTDIVSDAFVLYANRKGAEAADANHPYGHGRFETAASLVLGLLLAATGGGILISAAGRLASLDSLPPVGVAALWAALLTLLTKEGLFRYMLATAERLRSPMLVANAWHARADALSSLVVAAGIGGALLGFPFTDAAAAIIVGAMIVRAGLRFAWQALQELIDTGLTAEEVAALRQTLLETPGILGLHELRTRRMAHHVLVDAHLQVSPRISVSEGHRIGEFARQRVLDRHPEVLDVLVHIDAEDDLANHGMVDLPAREALLSHLSNRLDMAPSALKDTLLHYLGNRVEADIFLSATAPEAARGEQLKDRIEQMLIDDPWFSAIRIHYSSAS